jgi:hypothetical protein
MPTRQFFNHPAHHRTGGIASRASAFALCVDRTHRANDVMSLIVAGGPLDACEVIPAGSCNSTVWNDWQGTPLPTVSGIDRP